MYDVEGFSDIYWNENKALKSKPCRNPILVFEERGNRSTRRKTSRSRVENQQTQPTYDAGSGNRTRATLAPLVGGECSHHYGSPAPLKISPFLDKLPYYRKVTLHEIKV